MEMRRKFGWRRIAGRWCIALLGAIVTGSLEALGLDDSSVDASAAESCCGLNQCWPIRYSNVRTCLFGSTCSSPLARRKRAEHLYQMPMNREADIAGAPST